MRRGVQFRLVGAVLALAASASAQGAPEWQLRDFHSTVSVAGNGSAIILERLDLRWRALSQRRRFASERCDPTRTVHSYSQ